MATPLVFRASYRDINLITTIANKVVQRIQQPPTEEGIAKTQATPTVHSSRSNLSPSATVIAEPHGQARMLVTKEQVRDIALGALSDLD